LCYSSQKHSVIVTGALSLFAVQYRLIYSIAHENVVVHIQDVVAHVNDVVVHVTDVVVHVNDVVHHVVAHVNEQMG
jgi:hypothetical protein